LSSELKSSKQYPLLNGHHNSNILSRALSPRIISYTTPTDMDDFTSDSPATKSGASVTYGPYNNVPSSANTKFVKTHQQPITVHWSHDQPVLEILDLQRTAEVSHWGANLNIDDTMTLHNAGPK
jgi:oligosaccharyltransferase complex subunit alpha (ribophorin I)